MTINQLIDCSVSFSTDNFQKYIYTFFEEKGYNEDLSMICMHS